MTVIGHGDISGGGERTFAVDGSAGCVGNIHITGSIDAACNIQIFAVGQSNIFGFNISIDSGGFACRGTGGSDGEIIISITDGSGEGFGVVFGQIKLAAFNADTFHNVDIAFLNGKTEVFRITIDGDLTIGNQLVPNIFSQAASGNVDDLTTGEAIDKIDNDITGNIQGISSDGGGAVNLEGLAVGNIQSTDIQRGSSGKGNRAVDNNRCSLFNIDKGVAHLNGAQNNFIRSDIVVFNTDVEG